MKTTTHRGARRRGGFALIITIVLVAFLVLILVGLATFTRVETQVADNSQQVAKARQNALMALNIAIGQLQKTTGPDQRVTATADIAAASTGGRLASGAAAQNTASVNGTGNGLAAVSGASIQSGTRYWTGVWGRAGTTYATPAKSVYEETPSPVLLNWLVSGNEDRTFTVGADGLVTASTADGRTGAIAPFTPGAPVTWPSSWDLANPSGWDTSAFADLKIKGSGPLQSAVLLVGPKAAGTAANSAGEAARDRYVVVPVEDIEVPASSVPGFSGATNLTIGRYGWWVGDEGVKASYTLSDPYPGKNNPDGSNGTAAEARLRLMSAARSGVELVNGFSAYPLADDTTATARLERVVDMAQASFLDSNLAGAVGLEALRSRFHDFGTASSGVLSDTLNGGLRRDLTYYFELSQAGWNAEDLEDEGIIPGTWSPNWGTAGSPEYAPKWDWLYSFYNTNPDLSSGEHAVRPETGKQQGIAPIITQFRMIVFTDTASIAPSTNLANLPPRDYSLPIKCNVAFVLANPYNFTLTVPNNSYEFMVTNTWSGGAHSDRPLQPPGLVISASDGNPNPGYGTFILLRADGTSDKSMLDTVRFTVPALSIPPGGTAVLSVKGSGQVAGASSPTPPASGSEEVVELEENDSGNPIAGISRYFTAASTFDFMAPTTPARTFALLYVHDAVFLTISLREQGGGAVLQTLADASFSKKGSPLGGQEGAIFLNAHIKFMPPARRDLDSSSVAEKGHYALYAYGRPYQDLNLRASVLDHLALDDLGKVRTPLSYAGGFSRSGSQSLTGEFTENLSPATWAENFGPETRSPVASTGVFFDFPRRSPGQPPVLSLAHLQHASLTTDDWHPQKTVHYQPAYAVGNSYSYPFVTRGKSVQSRNKVYYKPPASATRYFDMAYLLNTALWDGYFFSGIPQSGADFSPLNGRYSIYDGAPAAAVRDKYAASHLMVGGAFNINSTSHDAWVALLGGLNGLRVHDDSVSDGVPFPRTLWQPTGNELEGGSYKSAGSGDDAYSGYRRLTAAEIDQLAAEIVKRVRARGPFVSLSHFINRSLVNASTDFNSAVTDANGAGQLAAPSVPMGQGLMGPLQAAIDSTAAGINTFQEVNGVSAVEAGLGGANGDRVLFAGEALSSLTQAPPTSFGGTAYFADTAVDFAHLDPDYGDAKPPGPQGRTSTGLPGWLMQGDVLQAVGSALSARSDTFVIRTYGEVVNPATGLVEGRAWCEAHVQRLPTYVSAADDAPEVKPAALTSATNRTFGRQYRVVSFRWLSADDI